MDSTISQLCQAGDKGFIVTHGFWGTAQILTVALRLPTSLPTHAGPPWVNVNRLLPLATLPVPTRKHLIPS
jgi:hypothetical protein